MIKTPKIVDFAAYRLAKMWGTSYEQAQPQTYNTLTPEIEFMQLKHDPAPTFEFVDIEHKDFW